MVNQDSSESRHLEVRLNGLLVGRLGQTQGGGISFTYDETWLERPGKRPISLSLPTEPSHHSGDIVFNFFDNLLADNPAVKTSIQQIFQTKTKRPFDLLEAIGKDCIGAIQLQPPGAHYSIREIVGTPLSEAELASRLEGKPTSPHGMQRDNSVFRISLAGAQEKTGLLWHDKRWQSPEGTTPTTHIIKLPIGTINYNGIDLKKSVDNEWLCLKILELYGLKVAQTERLILGGKQVLSVKRFDRSLHSSGKWIMRLPQEDLCQALGYPPGFKYQSESGPGVLETMHLLQGSEQAVKDRADFFKANFLFWLMAAPDGHAKNFSIFLEAYNKYRLTPFYDVLSVYPLIEDKSLQAQEVKMAMALRGSKNYYRWYQFMLRHVFSTAEQCGLERDSTYAMVEETLKQTDSVLEQASQLLPTDFPSDISSAIFSGIDTTAQRMKKQLNTI